jgi:hypothetical protein
MERRLLLYRGFALLTSTFLIAHAHATWKPECTQLSRESRQFLNQKISAVVSPSSGSSSAEFFGCTQE